MGVVYASIKDSDPDVRAVAVAQVGRFGAGIIIGRADSSFDVPERGNSAVWADVSDVRIVSQLSDAGYRQVGDDKAELVKRSGESPPSDSQSSLA